MRGYDAERDCARVRHELAQAITATNRPRARRRPGDPPPPAADTADFADFRQRYLTLQQDMETAIGQLRGRLRVAVAARSSGMARLATLDAIMERVLGARERSLLSAIPALLGTRFRAAARRGSGRRWPTPNPRPRPQPQLIRPTPPRW